MRWSKTLQWYKNNNGEITFSKKTGKKIKSLVGKCVFCDRKKSMIVRDHTIEAEILGNVFKTLRKISAKTGKRLATYILKNPGRALEVTSNIATAAATINPKAALSSLPEVINFYYTGKRLHLGKFVYIFLCKWNKNR